MSLYLCYDIKGIQSFIFKIPKLKYIIGGSALIDQFDRETMKNLAVSGTERIFSAGGRGAFRCDQKEAADILKGEILKEAQKIGVDIRFGIDKDFSEAANNAEDIHSYTPQELDGEPCPASGLYPVKNSDEDHPIVRKRIFSKGEKIDRWFESELLDKLTVIPGSDAELEFFRNVDSDDLDGGKEGAEAIGGRNRWAVICMDGNDMGMQFRKKSASNVSDVEMSDWLEKMSAALDQCSREAARCGIQQVIREWHKGEKTGLAPDRIVLPVRPIVVGGDDIIILCHAEYARTFVKEATRVFTETSIREQQEAGIELWPATNGMLTISSGILYCPVSLPLHTAIAYSESLLASAKWRGRMSVIKGEPTPACIDWEQLTESVVDTPAARRQRELVFFDEDLNVTVSLTRRPYTMDDFNDIEDLAKKYEDIPKTIRHQVLPALRAGYSDRLSFVADIRNNQKKLADDLCEIGPRSRWKIENGKERSTDVIDALLLLEETKRMCRETNNG